MLSPLPTSCITRKGVIMIYFYTHARSSHYTRQEWDPLLRWHSRPPEPESYLHHFRSPQVGAPLIEWYHYCLRAMFSQLVIFPHVTEVDPSPFMIREANPLFPGIHKTDHWDKNVHEADPLILYALRGISHFRRESASSCHTYRFVFLSLLLSMCFLSMCFPSKCSLPGSCLFLDLTSYLLLLSQKSHSICLPTISLSS